MRSFPALLLFVVCPYVSAAVLDVGQITLTGSGTFKSPVQDAMIALSFSAYGSNGTDWISINASFFQFWNDGGGFLSDVEYPDLAIGRTFAFGVGDIEQCTVGDFFLIDVCGVSIDGISGYGSFTGVGGGGGLVQVFARPD